MSAPILFTFDIFGTVCNWREGVIRDLSRLEIDCDETKFNAIIDCQARLEAQQFRSYAEITVLSLIEVCGLQPHHAEVIGKAVGAWPLYEDSAEALRMLQTAAPCAAMTNSDAEHGAQIQAQLGFELDHWFPAGEVGLYKPHPDFWRRVSAALGVHLGQNWWHVSAYADYDLDVARSLGLTTVFIDRPHARPGPADHRFKSLIEFARSVS